jgi:hypothetical protein
MRLAPLTAQNHRSPFSRPTRYTRIASRIIAHDCVYELSIRNYLTSLTSCAKARMTLGGILQSFSYCASRLLSRGNRSASAPIFSSSKSLLASPLRAVSHDARAYLQ